MVNPLDDHHFDMTGNFSEDDIQHLLGVMNNSHEDTSSGENVANPIVAMQAGVEAAVAAVVGLPSEPVAPPKCNVDNNNTNSNNNSDSCDNNNNNNSSHVEIDEEAKVLARSERKRSREKQRRMDVNKQFTDLTTLISLIEQEEREEDPTVFRQSFSATNRADLIARTISHMERLRDTNKRRKTECVTFQQQLQESQKAGEEIANKYKEALCSSKTQGKMMPEQNKQVMMMVPMMMPANAAHSMPQFGMQMGAMNQFMMPQPFMPQPPAPPTAAAPAVAPQAQAPQHHAQAPAQQQQQQPHQPHQPHQQPQPQAPQVPTMMTPQQMMFNSMQSVFPHMVDPNATNAAIAATTHVQPATQAHMQMQAMPQMQMQMSPYTNFQMPPPAAPSPTAPVAAEQKTEDATAQHPHQQNQQNQQQQPQQHQHQQQQPSNGGQGNSSSAGGSNYAHCA